MRARNENYRMLEYRIMDALEMTYSKNGDALKEVKTKLLEHPLKDMNLCPLRGFTLDHMLVIVQNGHSKKIKKLYFLDACNESIKQISIPEGE